MICLVCSQPFKEKTHPSLAVCSFPCLKELKEKKRISFETFKMKMIPQKGRGKFHQQWVTLSKHK